MVECEHEKRGHARGRAVKTRESRTETDLRKNSPRSNLSSFFAINLHNFTFLPAARDSEKRGTTASGLCQTNRQLCRLLFWQTNCTMLSRLASSLEPTSCCCWFFFLRSVKTMRHVKLKISVKLLFCRVNLSIFYVHVVVVVVA